MGLVERKTLIAELSPPLDNLLATQLVDEFVSLERRYIQSDWGPAELDGGQFCEVLARIVYHLDSGTLSLSKDLQDCIRYVENDQVPHAIQPRHNAIHLMKVLGTTYKLRSQRGGVHVSPTYTANQMDAKLIVENARWAMNEALRLFWRGDREQAAKAIREILQFDVPSVGKFENVIIVQRTDLSTEEELLILLHFAGEQGFSRTELGRYSMATPPAITKAIQKLASPALRQVVLVGDGRYRLTDLGSKRVREELASKLLLS